MIRPLILANQELTSTAVDYSFLKRGVAASDLVDYISYPYWYTLQDVMDKIDPAGMQAAR